MKLKLFVVRKYVWAKSAAQAIKKEKNVTPDDVWIDDDWKKNNEEGGDRPIGFKEKH